MTVLLGRHGGPSDLHEYRAATLSTMATLTGHTLVLGALPDGSRPDVLQGCPDDTSVFVGDAKATETPGNSETFARLSRYSAFLAARVWHGRTGVLALVVSEADAYGWLRVLRDLAPSPFSGVRAGGHVDRIEPGMAVVWHEFLVVDTQARVGP